MLIRDARMTDAIEIARLSLQLGYEVSVNEVSKRMDKILLNNDNAVFVMEVRDNKIAGWAHVHGRELMEVHPFAEIGGLVVDKNYRRQGIGESLMRKCEEWAREKGYQEVRLRSGGHRKDAHAFYKRIGYNNVKWQEVFSMNLSHLRER